MDRTGTLNLVNCRVLLAVLLLLITFKLPFLFSFKFCVIPDAGLTNEVAPASYVGVEPGPESKE